MSPKRITRLALSVAGISALGLVVMAIWRPEWGLLTWWPAAGLVLALVLLASSLIKGAYLTAQKRAEMVELLNDCYTGQTEADRAPR